MKFGIFYEHQIARPWPEDDTDGMETLLKNALDQVELADKLGFDYVWEVEHHFLEEYSHSSAPEVFLAAASQRTKQIRLGHGIMLMLPGFNHPARCAERIATLDLISGGRVEWGTGESSSEAELGGFGINRKEKRAMWEEGVSAATRMLVESPFTGFEGKYVNMPARNVMPKSKQKPHPPLWVACSRRETIHMAAERGMGALSFSFIEPEEAKEWVDDYYKTIESSCDPIGYNVNPNIALTIPFMCHKNEDEAVERGIDGAHFFGYSLAHYYVFGTHRPGKTNIAEEFEQRRAQFGFSREVIQDTKGLPLGAKMLQKGLGALRGAIGTPDQVRELCRRYEKAGVDQIIFVAQTGQTRHEDICASMELFAKEVMPEFKEREDAHQKEKNERLADAIARALEKRKYDPNPEVKEVIRAAAAP
ncbi:MAG: LLM class flavin-dependent oxidoreductase [Chrysiogenetes bacterium]|nr:LLM class flavin-dependent oxidoreductase [Chrysiogenetes bacterium]